MDLSPPSISADSTINSEISSLDDEEIGISIDFLEKLEPDDLQELKVFFLPPNTDYKAQLQQRGFENDHPPPYYGLPLNKEQFVAAVNEAIGSPTYTLAASRLFEEMEKREILKEGVIWWEQILDCIIEKLTEKQKMQSLAPPVQECKTVVHKLDHCKRDTIVKMITLENGKDFCYMVVCERGDVGLYNALMKLLGSYSLELRLAWVTDATAAHPYLFIATSSRCIYIFNTTRLCHVPLFHISGVPNIPRSIYYAPKLADSEGSMLIVGDDKGNITQLTFLKPTICLFERKNTDKVDAYFWMEIKKQKTWVKIVVAREVHRNEVQRIEYFIEDNTVVSCSQDPDTALVIRYKRHNRAPLRFVISRGVKCFSLNRCAGLLATGGREGIIQLWNPLVTTDPLSTFPPHSAPIIDIIIPKQMNALFSFSEDGVLKVWDLEERSCVQTVTIEIVGSLANHAFCPGPPPPPDKIWDRPWLNVVGGNLVAVLKISDFEQEYSLPSPPAKELEAALPARQYPALLEKIFEDGLGKEYKISFQASKMAAIVKEGAPYLALKLWDLEDIKLPKEPEELIEK